jgi:hypothetical protein
MTSATGERRKQSQLIHHVVAINAAELARRRQAAAPRETSRWRSDVRGLRWSIRQSASRLKTIAAVRAKTMQRMISTMVRVGGRPRAATSIEPSAKGSAKMVCEKRMKRSSRGNAPRPGSALTSPRAQTLALRPRRTFR